MLAISAKPARCQSSVIRSHVWSGVLIVTMNIPQAATTSSHILPALPPLRSPVTMFLWAYWSMETNRGLASIEYRHHSKFPRATQDHCIACDGNEAELPSQFLLPPKTCHSTLVLLCSELPSILNSICMVLFVSPRVVHT